MNNVINNLATVLKVEGFTTSAGRQAWGELATILQPIAHKKVNAYLAVTCELRLEEDTLLSLALVEGIKRAVTDWDITRSNFISRYSYILPYLFRTHKRNECNIDKRKGMALAGSTSAPLGVDDLTLQDTLVDPAPPIEYTSETGILLKGIFTAYREEHGEQKSVLAEIIMKYEDYPVTRNQLICKHFECSEYSATIRKRVERAKKHFLTFCEDNREFLIAS